MTKFSRLALALPVAALMASPAVANTFFEFSVSFGAGNTLTGTTGVGQNQFGTAYNVVGFQSLSFNSVNILPNLYTNANNDAMILNAQGNPVERDASAVTFTFSGSSFSLSNFLYFTPNTPWNFGSSGNAEWRSISNGPNGPQLRSGTGEGTFDEEFVISTAGFTTVGNQTASSVALVPEINGSGFAYIAFILGALGLWLYSGAARGRQEETPAVA